MDESEDNMSADNMQNINMSGKLKPKKRSLVERELETNLTARVTSPVTNGDATSTSRYGRARRIKTDSDLSDVEKVATKTLKSPYEKSPINPQSPVYKMYASNTPIKTEPPKTISVDTDLDNQIENIYNANISLSRFGSEEKKNTSQSPAKKFPKVYIRKDLIQSKEKEETVTLIKNMFSPVKSAYKPNSHINNILERSSEKYTLNGLTKHQNGYLDNSSVVKTLDFDSGKKRKRDSRESKPVISKSDLFELEAKCEYQVGDVAWARMGTFPFWPCIVTREPGSEMFVKKKLFGRVEHDVIHVTFLGDNGRRSWIVDSMLRKFLGLPEFQETKEQFTPEAKKKDPRLYAAFFISEKKQTLWNTSVEEAEMLLREPKRLRIDLLYDLLGKSRVAKTNPKQKGGKITRADSDVSLSESLYDTLFSEEDGKVDDKDRPGNKTRNISLDVSDVVTACLDNMAAKTGMTKIQRQSHMDRWLQKAKSKTPEKLKVTVTVERLEKEKDKEKAKGREKESRRDSKKKVKDTIKVTKNPYSLRRSMNESQNLLSHHNEHDYSTVYSDNTEASDVKLDDTDSATPDAVILNESENSTNLINVEQDKNKDEDESKITAVNEKVVETEPNNTNVPVINEDIISESEKPKDVTVSSRGLLISAPEPTNVLAVEEALLPEPKSNHMEVDNDDNDASNAVSSINITITSNDIIKNEVNTTNDVKSDDIHLSNVMEVDVPIEDKLLTESKEDDNVGKYNKIESELIFLEKRETATAVVNEMIESIDDNSVTNEKDVEMTPSTDITLKGADDNILELGNIEQNLPKNCVNVDCNKEAEKFDLNETSDRNSDDDSNADLNNSEHNFEASDHIDNVNYCNNNASELELSKFISVADKKSDEINKDAEENCTDIEASKENIDGSMCTKDSMTEIVTICTNKSQNNDISEIINESTIMETSYESENAEKDINNEASSNTLTSKNDVQSENTDNYFCKKVDLDDRFKNDDRIKRNAIVRVQKLNLEPCFTQNKIAYEEQNTSNTSIEANATINGFVKNHIDTIKKELLLDSETESLASEGDEIALSVVKQLKTISSRKAKIAANDETDSQDSDVSLSKRKLRSRASGIQIDAIESKLPKVVEVECKTEIEINSQASPNTPEATNKSKSSLRVKNSSLETVKQNGLIDSEDEHSEKKVKEEIDMDAVSLNSEDSGVSIKRRRQKDKAADRIEDKLQHPDFLKYLELRQDALIDEHPELNQDEITFYLYKTWLYEESVKSDMKKSDDIEQSNLVKGLNQDTTQAKKVRKKTKERKKLINIDKVLSEDVKNNLGNCDEIIPKEKPKRKTSQPYYNEDFSDIEEEIKLFEIFQSKSKPKESKLVDLTSDNKSEATKPTISTDTIKIDDIGDEVIALDEYYDEEERYFEQLTQPKPNVFKGLIREKVCEICENTSNLVKCKGCNGMFHVDCVQKETKVIEVPITVRGRKKKKKPRGRKPKLSTDSNVDSESQSDEKSQDANVSEDQNMSIDDELEPIVADADYFEAQLSQKIKDIMETEHIDYDSYSSDDCLDWDKTVPGKCEIVDVLLKPKIKQEETDYSDFKCNHCQKHELPLCFVCKSTVSKTQNERRQKCQVAHCQKYYHLECLDHWPQTQFNSGEPSRNNKKINEHFEALTCPRHVCHTCVCDDPRGCKTRFSGDKLARCVRCPATYHSFTKCLPAGSQILTASLIICPRHYEHRPGKVPCHVNTGWCFICALGGSLICCEYCPTSFHAECLNISPPEGGYMCEDCETGRLPLYGEMVWVKLGHYRWWPGIILHPSEIPDNILAVKHSLGEFVVRFFGQYDHYWVNRGRVFPFQEGDSGKISSQKSKIDEAFTKAMEHAHRAFEILKNVEPNELESIDIASSLLPPHYVKLKVNRPCGSLYGRRVDMEESSLTQCECNPDEEDPCGMYSHCLNRMLLTECGPTCRAGDRCSNRAFEKRLYPKLVPYRAHNRGWGLKTLEPVKAGQFVIEYVGELIDEEEFRRRMSRKHEIRDENFYFLTLDKERMIDAGPKGNLARFMNHCCEPNCETQKWTVLGDIRVGLFAITDIPANSEVTFNYNLECAGIEKKRCLCGAKRCSGYIGAKPKQDDAQPKKGKLPGKRPYKKRKNIEESPSTSKSKPKRPVGRPAKPRELTEIEKDLLIIKNATNGISSDSESSDRLSSIEGEKNAKALKRKRVSFSTEDSYDTSSVKRLKIEEKSEVGD